MKARMRLCASIILLVMTLLGEYCYGQNYVPKADELLYGTWINESATTHQKVVAFPGGYKTYDKISDAKPFEGGKEQIAEKWTDSEGNVWYKTCLTTTFGIVPSGVHKGYDYSGWKFQVLLKFSKSGTVRELMAVHVPEFDPNLYPTKIDPTDIDHYLIFYRPKE